MCYILFLRQADCFENEQQDGVHPKGRHRGDAGWQSLSSGIAYQNCRNECREEENNPFVPGFIVSRNERQFLSFFPIFKV